MTVKKSLENRIRGWFPHEPTMISTRLEMTRESKQPPLIIPPEYNVNATKFAGAFSIFSIIFWGFMIFSIDFTMHPISAFQIVAWIIAGLAVGVISEAVFTKNQLSRLSKDYQFTTNGKDWVLLIVPMILFFIFGGYVSWLINSSIQWFVISVYAWGVSYLLTRFILLAAFEKKTNMRLMQSWWGSTIILVPKAPTLEMSTEQRH
jgi:hypothetical protein